MSDDDKTTTDEPASDAVEEVTPEPAAEPEVTEPEAESETTEEAKEETSEPAAEEPKADEAAAQAAPTAEPAGTDQQGRTLYNVKCTNCGKDTQVPFQPAGGRPVYCRDCYMQKKNS